MAPGRKRDSFRLMKVVKQPGGIKTLSDEELQEWIANRRAGLARVEADKRGNKARRGWRESIEEAEAELARRREPAEDG